MKVKTCSKCGETKPISEFPRKTASKDRLSVWCKACAAEYNHNRYKARREEQAEYMRKWREKHREERAEYDRRWHKEHREEKAEYNRKWRKANPEKASEHKRKWRREHPEKVAERMRKWREANPEKKAEYNRNWREEHAKYSRKWYKAHRENQIEYSRKYYEAHPEKARARNAKRRALKRNATVGDREAIQHIYDIAANAKRVRCYLCGGLIPKGERHVDHIVPLSKGGLHTASNLAVTCAQCNLNKHTKLPEEVGILL